MLFEDRFEANRLPPNSASVPLDSVNLWCYCGLESGRRRGQRNDRPERRLRPQGPRSRHQIRRTPTTSSLPFRDKPEIPKLSLAHPHFSKDSMAGSNFQRLEDECMCWFSTEYDNQIEEATTGQRLGIKQMHWHSNWVVRETELDAPRPCPVCLVDRTRVLFRFSESQQASLHLSAEAEAVFRMLKRPKRDLFEFSDSRKITLGDLPAGLIFDVLVVPGSEQLSTLLEMEPAVQHGEEEGEKEPLLARLLARF